MVAYYSRILPRNLWQLLWEADKDLTVGPPSWAGQTGVFGKSLVLWLSQVDVMTAERIPWTEKRTNVSILTELGNIPEEWLQNTIVSRTCEAPWLLGKGHLRGHYWGKEGERPTKKKVEPRYIRKIEHNRHRGWTPCTRQRCFQTSCQRRYVPESICHLEEEEESSVKIFEF